METSVKAENLNVFYKKKQILYDVSFEIKEGEILGLVGESGSGKSTLAKAIVGINKEYTGDLSADRSNISMIFQDPAGSLNPAFRIGKILEEPLKIAGMLSKEEREKEVIRMLKRVELDPFLVDRFPRQLSGGQRQRVCIANALIQSPRLLIADEPVSALDVTVQAQVVELLKRVKKEMDLSILFISHDLRVVYNMCDRVMIMKNGRIVECGERDEIYFNPQNDYTKELLKAAGIT